MSQFELIFVVDDLPDEAIGHIYDNFDALVSAHNGQTLLTITAEGNTPLFAAKSIVSSLEETDGVHINECHAVEDNDPEKVSTTDLADINRWLANRHTL